MDAGVTDTLVNAWSSYNDALLESPLLTKSVTAGIILGAADLAGQALENSKKEEGDSKPIDVARFARFAFFGFILQAPWNHFYYQFLDGALPPTEDPFTATTGIKVVIDQFVQAPIFTVIIFYCKFVVCLFVCFVQVMRLVCVCFRKLTIQLTLRQSLVFWRGNQPMMSRINWIEITRIQWWQTGSYGFQQLQ